MHSFNHIKGILSKVEQCCATLLVHLDESIKSLTQVPFFHMMQYAQFVSHDNVTKKVIKQVLGI